MARKKIHFVRQQKAARGERVTIKANRSSSPNLTIHGSCTKECPAHGEVVGTVQKGHGQVVKAPPDDVSHTFSMPPTLAAAAATAAAADAWAGKEETQERHQTEENISHEQPAEPLSGKASAASPLSSGISQEEAGGCDDSKPSDDEAGTSSTDGDDSSSRSKDFSGEVDGSKPSDDEGTWEDVCDNEGSKPSDDEADGIKLGEGSYGVVHLVEIGGIRAVRKSPKKAKSLQQEAELMSLCQHPHVVHLLSHPHEGHHLLMEFCEGGDLFEHLHRIRRGGNGQAYHCWYNQLAMAVAHIHARGVAHRDLNPTNVYVRTNQELAIGDFGSASPANEAFFDLVGSDGYIAPEAYQQNSTGYDGRMADIWSLCQIFMDISGVKLPPAHAADELVFMASEIPDERPTAEEVVQLLSEP